MELEGNAWQKPMGGKLFQGICGSPRRSGFAQAALKLHFPCSSNLLQFLGKSLAFRCVASVRGDRRVKGDSQGERVPAMELDADPGVSAGGPS